MRSSESVSLYQAIILAFVQALTEFLPVSSSAHLALAPWLFGWPDQGLEFDIALHFGTLLAVITYFLRDWMQVIAQAFGIRYSPDPDLRLNGSLLWLIVAATIPVGVAGLALEDYVETTIRSNHVVIGGMLVLVGILMYFADKKSSCNRSIGTMTFLDAMTIGLFQALAVVPGTSRSGITITAGLLRNLDRPSAARFSFLLSTPAIGAAALKSFYDLYRHGGIPPDMRLQFAVGVGVSAITGLAVIAFFLKFLRSNTLRFFIAYRIVFGIIVIALALFLR
ncbi:MAG TPA: undecaprenyl-diphosphate phosphatase [Bryobacteraceae bacterium]|nr:undecaprenyl-diphosphate phosphatase [Bryobacteraceae bacterium]